MKQSDNRPLISKEGQERVNVFNKYNDLVENIKGMLFEGLRYEEKDGLFYHEAYFGVGEKITYESIAEKTKQASEKIEKLEELKKQIQGEYILNATQKGLINNNIQISIDTLEYHKNVIYIEAEKAGFILTDEEREKFNKRKLEIEQKLYGDSITKLEFRKNKVLDKLKELFDKYDKEKLSEEEKLFWKEKIEILFENKSLQKDNKEKINTIPDVYIKEDNIFPLLELLLQIEGFKEDDYVKIQFNKDKSENEVKKIDGIFILPASRKPKEIYEYFDNIGLGQKFKIIKKNSGNNSVSIIKEDNMFKKNEISLSAPKDGKYNLTKNVLPIMFDHETSTHVNTGIGNFFNLNLRDPERGDLEEAIAIVNERFSKGGDLESVYETSKGDVCQFLGEVLDDENLKQAVSIYFKLSGDKEDVESRCRRIRMGVPKGKKGSRRKDLTYGKSKEIVKELEELTKTPEGIEMLNKYARVIYSTKLGNEAIKNIDEILEGITEVEKLEPNFPIFAGKIIYRKLFKGKLNKDEMLKNDLRSLIRTNKSINYEQKRLLVQILQKIEQDCEYQKSINQSE